MRAWLRIPVGIAQPLPAVVEFVGYGGGRGHAAEDLFWSSAGFAHLQMDIRGQGSIWSPGGTADPEGSSPSAPGFMSRGIESPDTYYDRRLMTDAVRAIDAARSLPSIDATQVSVLGFIQGGGLALAYFDGVNFAKRATAPARFSTALMDATCPPSTVFAAFNAYQVDKQIAVWPYNAHEGGQIEDELTALHELAAASLAP